MKETTFVRVGHKGAAALAPENTIASLAAAIEHGVDMIEFDVVDAPDGRLVLAHSHEEIAPGAPTLDEALAFLAAEAPGQVEIDLDLKWYGFESTIVDSLRAHGVLERALVSSFFSRTLHELKRLEPGLRTGLSYPWDRRGLSTKRVLQPAVGVGAAALRRALPYRIGRMVRRAGAGSAMLHYAVISRATVERCHGLGIPVFAWTVDDPDLLEVLVWMGVDGIITNDPRIFGSDGSRR